MGPLRGIEQRLALAALLCMVGCAAGTAGADGGPATFGPATDSSASASGPGTSAGDGGSGASAGGGPSSSGSASATSVGAECMDASECDDDDPCTDDDCGTDGLCTNDATDCDDGLLCTSDFCDSTMGCINTPDDTVCDNEDACDGTETCEPTDGCTPGADAVVCEDMQACTQNVCDPATGDCSFPAVDCLDGDGCCPAGCSAAIDDDCVCTNFAPSATPSSNGGGLESTGFGPSNWLDGIDQAGCVAAGCNQCYGWVMNQPCGTLGAFLHLTWPSTVTIGSTYVDTENAVGAACGFNGRNLAGGEVQYWDGAAWQTAATFAGETGDLAFDFNPPISTTQLRLFNVVCPAGGINPLAFEWYVYTPTGCTP